MKTYLCKYEVKLLWSFVEGGGKFAEMSVFISSSQSAFCILIVSSNRFWKSIFSEKLKKIFSIFVIFLLAKMFFSPIWINFENTLATDAFNKKPIIKAGFVYFIIYNPNFFRKLSCLPLIFGSRLTGAQDRVWVRKTARTYPRLMITYIIVCISK